MNAGELKNKTILVTGGASGMGLRTVQLLNAAGAHVIVMDRNAPTEACAQYIEIDLADRRSIEHAVARIDADGLDGLCNIAGVPGTASASLVGSVNYFGLRVLTEALIPRLHTNSAIVNLASVAGSNWRERIDVLRTLADSDAWHADTRWYGSDGMDGGAAYKLYKEALIVWTMARATSLAREQGIRMNCVSPGPVNTPILADFRDSLGQKHVEDCIARTGRAAEADDVANVVIFLLTGAARWIVGAEIIADGGLVASRLAGAGR